MVSVFPDPAERPLSLKYFTIKPLFKKSFSRNQSTNACADDADIFNITSHLTLSLGDIAMNVSQAGIENGSGQCSAERAVLKLNRPGFLLNHRIINIKPGNSNNAAQPIVGATKE